VAVVAEQRLVAAVAGEQDRRLRTRRGAHGGEGERRGIGAQLARRRDERAQPVGGAVVAAHDAVRRTEPPCEIGGRGGFVVGAGVERARVRDERRRRAFVRDGERRRRIEPARQEDADRPIGRQPQSHGFAEQLFELGGRRRRVARRRVGERRRPVATKARRGVAGGKTEQVRGWKREHAFERRLRRRHVAAAEERGEDVLPRAASERARERAALRREPQGAVFEGVEERLLAEAVARERQGARRRVVDRESERAAEAEDDVVAVAREERQQQFAVGGAAKDAAVREDVGAQRLVVVELTVHDRRAARDVVAERLRPGVREVVDREAPMTEDRAVERRESGAVRTAMREQPEHPPDPLGRCGRSVARDSRDAAHARRF
jgi:hypothetical protein